MHTFGQAAASCKLQPRHVPSPPQEHELLAGRTALLAAQRAVSEKSTSAAAAKADLWAAKKRMARQAALLDAVAQDVAYVLQQSDERVPGSKTARQRALEALSAKYCTRRGGGATTSADAEAELRAHTTAAERKAALLEDDLQQVLLRVICWWRLMGSISLAVHFVLSTWH